MISPCSARIPARQPDTKLLRTWEVAGASHADFYQGRIGFGDVGDGKAEQALLDVAAADGGALNCAQPINRGPQYLVLASALDHLDRWVADGVGAAQRTADRHGRRTAVGHQP